MMNNLKSPVHPRTIIVRGLMMCLTVSIAAGARASINPDALLIYYGWPSAVNQTFSISGAAGVFGQYDIVVLGDGLQNGPGTSSPHPDHFNTRGIVNHALTSGTDFYGYIDLGVTTQNLPLAEIYRRVDAWKAMGLEGVLLDDFGYDFGVTRARQNAAVEYAHQQGMRVIANGWRPEDVFSTAVHANNPLGLAPALGASDYYLSESHQIIVGKYDFAASWLSKARKVENFQKQYGFEVLSITTNDLRNLYEEPEFFYAWFSAALFGHAATGWGEYVFSASGPANAQATYRERPNVYLGEVFLSEVVQRSSRQNRKTDAGVIFVDTTTREYGLLPLGDMDGNGRLDALDVDDFEKAITNLNAYMAANPKLDPLLLADFNNDGMLSGFDTREFERRLANVALGFPITEPGALAALLLLTAASAFRRTRR